MYSARLNYCIDSPVSNWLPGSLMESFKILETDVKDTSNQIVASVRGYPGDKFSECIEKIEGTKIFEWKSNRSVGSKFQDWAKTNQIR